MSPAEWLRARGSHTDLVEWARGTGADWPGLWEACPRGDWLLAIAARAGAPASSVGRAALEVARFGVDGSLPELDALLDRALGGETLAAEADALEARMEADPEVAALTLAVAVALRSGAAPTDAAMVPSLVAQAAAFGAGDCAMMAAVGYAQKKSAEIVRAAIPLAALALD